MPEGDAVWRTARRLDRALSGAALVRADFRVPGLATVDVTGAVVQNTRSRGKHLLTRLAHPDHGALTLHTHLKMEGLWQVHRPGERWRRPADQARVIVATPRSEAVGFALGIVELIATDTEPTALGHLGPDLLGPDWDLPEATRRILGRPDRPIWNALLDQRNLAGLGNMYALELCFLAGVHPLSTVSDVAGPDGVRLERMVTRAHHLLQFNKDQTSAVTTGDLRERLWVYRRDRRSCRRCGTPIEVRMLTADNGRPGAVRAAYWCPRCQPMAGQG